VQRELRCPLLTIALVALAQIRAEPAMCLGGDVFRATEIGSDVKEETSLVGLEIATLRSWRRMCDGALAFIPQESFGHGFAKRAVGLAAPGTCCVTSREVCGLELVILRCRTIQLVDRRRLVVDRRASIRTTPRSLSIS
jgi:hypothetical protein